MSEPQCIELPHRTRNRLFGQEYSQSKEFSSKRVNKLLLCNAEMAMVFKAWFIFFYLSFFPYRQLFYADAQSDQSLRCQLHWILITKTCLYNFDPLKPHFYKVKLGFTGVYIIFLISAKNIDCGYSLEPPRRGGSNEYPQSMFWSEICKI